ncbi:PfkB family carbohydrate kinase [Schaalia naturae]|uniref:PfkB family carbohydrate kinase n=1 Tax=Schaalia naturae TaxID=635203 RepID=A0ABW2SNC4_9ACTO
MTGRFISTHSVVLTIPLHIDHLPERGASEHADTATSQPGGGFTALAAVAALGVPAAMVSPLGTGPNSFAVRRQLVEAGVEILTEELVGDIGVAMTLVEADGSTTSVVTSGVESEPSRRVLDRVELRPGDLVHVAGADLTRETSAEVLSSWAAGLPGEVTLVLSVSPAVDQVPVWAWKKLLRRADVVTMNIREASTLGRILASSEPGTGVRHVLRPEAALVRRLGVMGCEVQADAAQARVQIPAFDSVVVDTAGVGDTHIAVMCAGILAGMDLVGACRMANAASALTISHESALPVPTRDQIDQVLAEGGVTYSY